LGSKAAAMMVPSSRPMVRTNSSSTSPFFWQQPTAAKCDTATKNHTKRSTLRMHAMLLVMGAPRCATTTVKSPHRHRYLIERRHAGAFEVRDDFAQPRRFDVPLQD